jgi:hypothetical protein
MRKESVDEIEEKGNNQGLRRSAEREERDGTTV